MKTPQLEVSITFVPMPQLVRVCDLCEEGAGVFGQRVEGNLVDDEANSLGKRESVYEAHQGSARLIANCFTHVENASS